MDVTHISLNSAAWATHFGRLAAMAASCDAVLVVSVVSGRVCRDWKLSHDSGTGDVTVDKDGMGWGWAGTRVFAGQGYDVQCRKA